MEKFTVEQRIKIDEFYIENRGSIVLIQSIHLLYPGQESPAKPAVGHLVQGFQRQESVGDLPAGRVGPVPAQEKAE